MPFGVSAQLEHDFEFMGLETEILPEIKNDKNFTPQDLFQSKSLDWNVKVKEVEQDKEPLKGQKFSLIPWEDQDPEEWLDINKWMIERSVKDQIPDWKMRLRDERHAELVGKLIQCHGVCQIYRGTQSAKGGHLSRVTEGDELRTNKDSTAWLYLMDGTLLRLSSNSSISLLEINFGQSEVFFQIRLNQGHVFWHPRQVSKLPINESPETDAVSLPLMIREANQEYFERHIFKKQKDIEQLSELLTLDDNAIQKQFDKINEMRALSGPSKLKTKVMMVAPNATIVSSEVSFDLVFTPGGKSYFKKRVSVSGEEFSLYLRGYNLIENFPLSEIAWHEVDPDGRSHALMNNPLGILQVTELITKRIKTLELAREVWFEKLTLPILNAIDDSKKMAVQFGYTLWGDEIGKRFNYLVEYTRRVETTNLRSIDNLLQKLEANGEKVVREATADHYQESLNYYLKGLKQRYTDRKMEVREMSDLQYYVWILNHGKL